MTERHTTPVVLALEALKYALDVALGDEWNVGELQIPEGDKRAGVGLIAVRKMRAAIYALETVVPSETAAPVAQSAGVALSDHRWHDIGEYEYVGPAKSVSLEAGERAYVNYRPTGRWFIVLPDSGEPQPGVTYAAPQAVDSVTGREAVLWPAVAAPVARSATVAFTPTPTAYFYLCPTCEREIQWEGPDAEISGLSKLKHSVCGTPGRDRSSFTR